LIGSSEPFAQNCRPAKIAAVKITLSEVEYLHGQSGVGLRCTLNLGVEHPRFGLVRQSTKGCLVFRNKRGDLNFLTPMMRLGAAKVAYRPISISPGLAQWLQQVVEKAHGSFIKRREQPHGSGIGAGFVGGDAELDLGDGLEERDEL
jgi:hypothetical protein